MIGTSSLPRLIGRRLDLGPPYTPCISPPAIGSCPLARGAGRQARPPAPPLIPISRFPYTPCISPRSAGCPHRAGAVEASESSEPRPCPPFWETDDCTGDCPRCYLTSHDRCVAVKRNRSG